MNTIINQTTKNVKPNLGKNTTSGKNTTMKSVRINSR